MPRLRTPGRTGPAGPHGSRAVWVWSRPCCRSAASCRPRGPGPSAARRGSSTAGSGEGGHASSHVPVLFALIPASASGAGRKCLRCHCVWRRCDCRRTRQRVGTTYRRPSWCRTKAASRRRCIPPGGVLGWLRSAREDTSIVAGGPTGWLTSIPSWPERCQSSTSYWATSYVWISACAAARRFPLTDRCECGCFVGHVDAADVVGAHELQPQAASGLTGCCRLNRTGSDGGSGGLDASAAVPSATLGPSGWSRGCSPSGRRPEVEDG